MALIIRLYFFIFITTQALFSQTISLQEAIVATLESHPDAKIALFLLEKSRANLGVTKALRHPEIILNGDYFPTKTLVMPTNGAFATRDSSTSHIDVTVTYTLWDFGRSSERINAAMYENDASLSLHENAQAVLIQKVWQAYYSLAYLHRLIKTTEHSLAFYQALYDQATHLRHSGLKTQIDEERFYASLLESKDTLAIAHSEEKKSLQILSLLTALPLESIVIEDDFEVLSQTTIPLLSEEKWRTLLMENNAQLSAFSFKIKQSESLHVSSSLEKYGTISAVASTGYDDSLSSYNTTQIGIKASIPLYTGGKLSHQEEKDRVGVLTSKEELRSLELTLWQELYGNIQDLKRLDATIKAKEAVAHSLAKAILIIKGRYAQGLATYIEVLEAQMAYDSALTSVNSAMLQKISSLANIHRLIPKGLTL